MLDGEEYESADPTTKPAYVKYEVESGQCGFVYGASITTIYYSGVLYGQMGIKTGIISRQKILEIPLSCEISMDLTVSVDNFFAPLLRNYLNMFQQNSTE